MFVYAVAKGLTPGIYNTWEECKAQIAGYPGAKYKKFLDSDVYAIKAFMGDAPVDLDAVLPKVEPIVTPSDTWIAYTDGSYNPATCVCGAGLVIFHDGVKDTYSGVNTDKAVESMRNITGEVLAASWAIDFALAAKAPKLIIRHDYIGISEWANGTYKAKTAYTQAYRDKVAAARQYMNITFEHISAHTGITHNEEADRLAKDAVGVERK